MLILCMDRYWPKTVLIIHTVLENNFAQKILLGANMISHGLEESGSA